jgi:hypothetical protein
MKVVRRHFRLFENKRLNPTGIDGNYPVLVLQRARNDEGQHAGILHQV